MKTYHFKDEFYEDTTWFADRIKEKILKEDPSFPIDKIKVMKSADGFRFTIGALDQESGDRFQKLDLYKRIIKSHEG